MKIINFGSLNIDRVYELTDFVTPGATVSARALNTFAGGKGLNQSIAAARAGAHVFHVGAVGSDGAFLLDLLKDAGADVSMTKTLDSESGHAIIQVNQNGQNCIIIYGGTNRKLTRDHIDAALGLAEPGDIALLQNETNNIPYIMEQASARGMKVAWNPSPIPENLSEFPLEKADYLIVNEIEGAALAGLGAEEKNFEVILSALREKYPKVRVVLTLGDQGVLYEDEAGKASHPVFQANAVDTTAAGDTFCGYFLAGICQGRPVSECLRQASAASSIAVSRSGAAPSIPVYKEVEAFLEKQA